MFFVHKYKIEEFSSIQTRVNADECLGFIELQGEPDDFRNMFKFLYSPYVISQDPS
jgi:hypothetical protein